MIFDIKVSVHDLVTRTNALNFEGTRLLLLCGDICDAYCMLITAF
jgi:hypothetical protein